MALYSFTPHNGDVTTFDGFLATRPRLFYHSSNARLEDFIREAAKRPKLRPEAKRALLSRAFKRDQSRKFVSVMDWATELEDEEMGLGFSDAAMDFQQHAWVVNPNVIQREEADVRLEREIGEHSYRQFLDAVAPRHLIHLENGQANGPVFWEVYAVYLEPLFWAARHWMAAGEPAIDQNHLIESMTTAFRVLKEDAIDRSGAARSHEHVDEDGMIFMKSSLKAISMPSDQHMAQLWDLGRTDSFIGRLRNGTIPATCEVQIKKDIMAETRKQKCKHRRITRSQVEFEELPTEILLRFVGFMSLKSLILCRSASKEWRLLVSSAKIPPFRQHLLDFYDSIISSLHFQTLPDRKYKPRRSRRYVDHENTEFEDLFTYFQTIPLNFILWKDEWPGRTDINYECSQRHNSHPYYVKGTSEMQFFLGGICVGWGKANSEFQERTFTLVDLEKSPALDQRHLN